MFNGNRPQYQPPAGAPAEVPSGGGPAGYDPAFVEDDEPFNIGEYIATLLSHKWLILLITAAAVFIGAANTYVTTPVYRADALLQVEEEAAGISALNALEALENMGDQGSSVDAEMQILRSRMILGQVVDRLKLDLVAAPRYLPVFGEAIARRYDGDGVAKPWFGMEELAWGGEAIEVSRLEVPDRLLGAPLRLTAGEAGGYAIADEDGTWNARGRVGEPLAHALPGGGELGVFVSRLKARPGTEFTVLRKPRNGAIGDLAGRLSVSEKGRGSGILELRLTGAERDALPGILDQVMRVYVRQNVERHSAEAKNTLQFLEAQLPALKAQLDAAEAAYNSYRLQEGSVDLTSETASVLQSVVEIENQLVALEQQRKEMLQRFKPQHPRVRAVDVQIEHLQGQLAKLDREVNKLPGTQQKILRLARDVEVNTHLYTELLNTTQQLRVAEAGTVGNVRVIDTAAVAPDPIAPRKGRILVISLVLGVLGALALIWLTRRLRVTVEDPETIERALGMPVYATIPHSKLEVLLSRDVRRGKTKLGVLAAHHSEEDAVESLRSLRTTLHFAVTEPGKAGVMVTGPSQGIGKSFVSKNLAWLLAEAGEAVVVVDADMRRGHMHREFGLHRDGGLSEYLAQGLSVGDVLKHTPNERLDIITCGTRPPNASELLMNPRFEKLVRALLDTHKHVIVDAPPVLAVSDAATIGRYLGTTLMVARAGQHPVAELEQAVKRLSLAGVKTAGYILNDLDTVRMRYRYGYSGYHYQYSYKSSKS